MAVEGIPQVADGKLFKSRGLMKVWHGAGESAGEGLRGTLAKCGNGHTSYTMNRNRSRGVNEGIPSGSSVNVIVISV